MPHRNKINLVFLISPKTYPVDANVNAPLKVARDKALRDADQTARPADEWETRYDGQVLDVSRKVEDLGLADGAQLELTVGFGAGG